MYNKKRIFIIISIVVFLLDLVFVAINYYTSKQTLYTSLFENAQEKQSNFELTLSMVFRNMLQISKSYSQRDDLNQLFLRGKKAVESEGGGAGKDKAHQARQMLLKKIKPGWDDMTKHFKVRQLHYHLGPGSLSYLRVHKPSKFGDRMDNIRYTIVDTNTETESRTGFETGRVYSGLRGVTPVWTIDPETNKKVYVGALEVGASFEQILPLISNNYHTNLAVLLTKPHIEQNMWPEFVEEYFHNNPNLDYYIESSSSNELKSIISHLKITGSSPL